MPDIQQNIVVSVNGSEAAQAALIKTGQAVNSVGRASKDLSAEFARKFEHVGIHTFGYQLLELAGISGHTRPIISAMGLAVSSAASSIGAAAGPIGLAVMGFTALAAVAYKVVEGHEKSAKSLEEEKAAADKLLKTYDDSLAVLARYEKAFGTLTPALRDAKKATEELRTAEIEQQRATIAATITGLQSSIIAHRDSIATIKEHRGEIDKSLAAYNGMAVAQGAATEKTKHDDEATKAHVKSILEAKKSIGELEDQLAKLTAGTTKNTEAQVTNREAVNKAAEEARKKDEEWIARQALMTAEYQNQQAKITGKLKAESDKRLAAIHNEESQIKAAWNSAWTAAGSTMATETARMIVYNQSMSEALKNVWKDLEVAVLAAIEQMIAKMIVLRAIEFATFSWFSAGAQVLPAFEPTPLPPGQMYASRGIDVPGAAAAPSISTSSFSARSFGDQGRGASPVSIGAIQIYGITDPAAIADEVGRRIVARVRGRGDIAFARQF